MFRKIKKSLKKVVDLRFIQIKDYQQTNFNYSLISQLFKKDSFIPFTNWSLSPDLILHVLNDITLNKRRSIIEFGSGSSTFYIAKLIQTLDLKSTSFVSIESNKEWFKEIQRQLRIYGIQDYVKVIYAPVIKVPDDLKFKSQESWYDIQELNSQLNPNLQFDLVMVDGPIGGKSPFARFSAIPFLKQRLGEKYSIFLDDIHRQDEQQIMREWEHSLSCRQQKNKYYAVLSNSSGFKINPFQLKRE